MSSTDTVLKLRKAKLKAGMDETIVDTDGMVIRESDVTRELEKVHTYKPDKK